MRVTMAMMLEATIVHSILDPSDDPLHELRGIEDSDDEEEENGDDDDNLFLHDGIDSGDVSHLADRDDNDKEKDEMGKMVTILPEKDQQRNPL